MTDILDLAYAETALVAPRPGVVAGLLNMRHAVSPMIEICNQLRRHHFSASSSAMLGSWAATLAVPTAIAGIYGINFKYMPELEWSLGYPAALLPMLAICGTLFYCFQRASWLEPTLRSVKPCAIRGTNRHKPQLRVFCSSRLWLSPRCLRPLGQ